MALCLAALLMPGMAHAQKAGYVPAPENLKARKEFSDNKFGIFLHWGIYSLFGQGEWYLNSGGLNCHEYAKAASAFYPSRFNASEWVGHQGGRSAVYMHHHTPPRRLLDVRHKIFRL